MKRNLRLSIFILFALFLSSFSQNVQAVGSLVGYWKFDETSNLAVAEDSSGNDNGASITNTITPSTDVPPAIEYASLRSIYLDSSKYLTINRPVQEDFTLCSWIKTASIGVGQDHWRVAGIFDSEVGTLADDFGFGIDDNGRLAYGNGGAFDATVHGSTTVADNSWHHVCATRSRGTGGVALYVDGNVDGTGTTDTAILDDNPLAFIGIGTDGGAEFVGNLDDFRVYNVVLSAEEIAALAAGDGLEPLSSDRSKINSWKINLSYNQSSCPVKLKVTIRGKRFDDDAEVTLGNHKASRVDVKSSKKLSASFCLEKFSQNQETIKKTLSVKNPGTKKVKANKRVDLTVPQLLGNPSTSFDQDTTEGVTNIQRVLVSQELLLQEDVIGIYGPKTTAAVKVFQTMYNIVPQTGNVGPKTIAAFQGILQ